MSGCPRASARCGVRRGQVYRTACRGPRCSRSMRAWPVPGLTVGRILRLSKSGDPASVPMSWRNAISRCLPSAGCRTKAAPLKRAQDIAARLRAALAGNRMTQEAAARAMGKGHPNRLRYAAPTGTVVIRWDGSRQPDVWNVPAPDMDPHEARLELARRYPARVRPRYARSIRDVGRHWAACRYCCIRSARQVVDAGAHTDREGVDPEPG